MNDNDKKQKIDKKPEYDQYGKLIVSDDNLLDEVSEKSDTQTDEGVKLEDTAEESWLVGEETSRNTAVKSEYHPEHVSSNTTVPGDLISEDGSLEDIDTPVQDSISGEEAPGSSAPAVTSDDDVLEMVEDVIGNEPEPGKPFSIADEVEKDELDRHGITDDDKTTR